MMKKKNRNRTKFEELRVPFNQKAHPQEETLELYALGRLQDPELGQLEEHLLVCDRCQDRLDETTEYIKVMKEAARNVVAEGVARKPEKRKWLLFSWLSAPLPASAGAFAVLLAILFWQPWEAASP